MSNNKQSSVEWLISQLQKSKDFQRVLNEISQMSSAKIDIIAEAKAMHKEEIIRARLSLDRSNLSDFDKALNNATEYYNETYGGNK